MNRQMGHCIVVAGVVSMLLLAAPGIATAAEYDSIGSLSRIYNASFAGRENNIKWFFFGGSQDTAAVWEGAAVTIADAVWPEFNGEWYLKAGIAEHWELWDTPTFDGVQATANVGRPGVSDGDGIPGGYVIAGHPGFVQGTDTIADNSDPRPSVTGIASHMWAPGNDNGNQFQSPHTTIEVKLPSNANYTGMEVELVECIWSELNGESYFLQFLANDGIATRHLLWKDAAFTMPVTPANPSAAGDTADAAGGNGASLPVGYLFAALNGRFVGPPPVVNVDTGEGFGTIQAAIDDADTLDGHTIEVAPGTYPETVTINKELTLNGANAGVCAVGRGTEGNAASESIIDASGTTSAVLIRASNVTLDGFEIVGDDDTRHGVYVVAQDNNFTNISVRNNYIHGMGRQNTSNSSVACYGVLADAKAGVSGPFGTIDELTIDCNEIHDLGGVLNPEPSIVSQGLGVSLHEIQSAGSGATITNNSFHDLGDGFDGATVQPAAGVFIGEDSNVVGPGPSSDVSIAGNQYADVTGGVAVFATDSNVDEDSSNFTNVLIKVLNIGRFTTINETLLAPFAKTDSPIGFPGSDAYTCKIQDALDISDGTTINVSPGTFSESVTVSSSVTLLGPNVGISPITGSRVPEAIMAGAGPSFLVNADDVTIEGFQFDNVTTQVIDAGVGLNVTNLVIRSNLFTDNNGPAVYMGAGPISNWLITDNKVDGITGPSTSGLFLVGPGDMTITNNSIGDTAYAGMVLHALTDSTVSGNTISNVPRQGIQLAGAASNVTISNNAITDANTESHADRGGIRMYGADFTGTILVTGNSISSSFNGLAITNGQDITGKDIHVTDNNLAGNANAAVYHGGTGVLDASGNWLGSNDPGTVASATSGDVDYTPWLDVGTDTSGDPGFQGDFSVLHVDDDSPQSGPTGRVQEGINSVSGSTVHVAAGTYNERINVNTSVELLGAQSGVDPTPSGARSVAANESIITEAGLSTPNPDVLVEIPSGVTDVVIDGFTLVGDPTTAVADTSTIRCWDDDLTIRNNIIDGRTGVLYKGADNLNVLSNRFTFNKNGFAGVQGTTTNLTVSGNTFDAGGSLDSDPAAIQVSAVTVGVFTDNTASGVTGGRGLGGSNLHQLDISSNSFTDCRDGINIFGGSTFIDMVGNILSNHSRYGINIKGQDITITGNTIAGNGDSGINIDRHVIDTERVNVHYNNISGNANFGLLVSSSVTETVDAENNWWGDASGPFDPDDDTFESVELGACTPAPENERNADGTGDGVDDTSTSAVDYCPWLNGAGTLILETDDCPDDADGALGFQIAVELHMRDLTQNADAFAAFLSYDAGYLSYRGDLSSYTTSPFPLHIQSIATADLGTTGVLNVDGSDNYGGSGTNQDALLATLIFDVTQECDIAAAVEYRPFLPFFSELSYQGVPLPTNLVETPAITADDTDPDITCPGNTTVECDGMGNTAQLDAWTAGFTATDNCSSVDLVTDFTGLSDDCGETGSATVTATATDPCGNDSTCMSTFTIEDTTAPVISCMTSQAMYSVDGGCEATVMLAGTVTDTCCIDAGNVSVGASLAMPNATLTFDESMDCTFTQVDANTVGVSCTALVSALESCPATVEFAVDAVDCCGNNAAQCTDTADVEDDTAPDVTVSNVMLNADAGGCDAEVTLTGSATDNCATIDPGDIVFTIDLDSNGFDGGDPMVTGSGSTFTFPVGTTGVEAAATDDCGNVGTTAFTVIVNGVNDVDLQIELAGVFNDALPLTRCIHFVTDDCNVTADVPLTFTDYDSNGATPLQFVGTVQIPCGNWTQLCAKDEQHTLYETTGLTDAGTYYTANSVLSLRGGDTDNDSDVDINDVTLLILTYGAPEAVAACPYDYVRGADFSNNGNVGAEDYTFLMSYWLTFTTCNCAFLPAAPEDEPIGFDRATAIDVALLTPQMAAKVDTNKDGKFDHRDIKAFEDRNGLPNTLSTAFREAEEKSASRGDRSAKPVSGKR